MSKKHWVLYFLTGILVCLVTGIFAWINPMGKQSGEEVKNFTGKQTHEEYENLVGKPLYEQVENLGEREGVCFDNLQMSSTIILYDCGSQEYKKRYFSGKLKLMKGMLCPNMFMIQQKNSSINTFSADAKSRTKNRYFYINREAA